MSLFSFFAIDLCLSQLNSSYFCPTFHISRNSTYHTLHIYIVIISFFTFGGTNYK